MLIISKDRSFLIKGIAILLMILYHFNPSDLCVNLLYVGDKPFVDWLSKACNPVSFFLILSGYGLAYTYEKTGLSVKGQLKRILKLYVHYWVVLALFLPIGCYMFPDCYPGSVTKLIQNVTGWDTTFNGVMWFLFPYCLVCLASPLIFFIINTMGYKRSLLLTACIQIVTCFLISRYSVKYLYDNNSIYQIVLFFHLLYYFTAGICLYRCHTSLNARLTSISAITLILSLVTAVAFWGNAVAYMIYTPIMIFLFCQISYPKWLEKVLMELGRKSMAIWMIHAWFCCILFQPQVYSLRYPIIIMVGITFVSYYTAIPVMLIARRVNIFLKL